MRRLITVFPVLRAGRAGPGPARLAGPTSRRREPSGTFPNRQAQVVHRNHPRHQGQVRHGRHSRRRIPHGQPARREGPQGRRGTAASRQDSALLDGQVRGDLGRIRSVLAHQAGAEGGQGAGDSQGRRRRSPGRRRPTPTRPSSRAARAIPFSASPSTPPWSIAAGCR